MDVDHRAVAKKTFFRLVPLLFFCYILAYLDRINVGFAALTMNKDIGLTAYIYGLGAGMFFIGYFFFEVPSNLMLQRFGARRWIARIMVSWGVVAMAMVFVAGPNCFLVMRFLIGVAEAGIFPRRHPLSHILVHRRPTARASSARSWWRSRCRWPWARRSLTCDPGPRRTPGPRRLAVALSRSKAGRPSPWRWWCGSSCPTGRTTPNGFPRSSASGCSKPSMPSSTRCIRRTA